MTDKEKIRAEIERLKQDIIDDNGNLGFKEHQIAYNKLSELLKYINSLSEDSVNENLEEAAIMHYKDVMEYEVKTGLKPSYMTSFKVGAQWQKEKMKRN